jgi:hypothetical protein
VTGIIFLHADGLHFINTDRAIGKVRHLVNCLKAGSDFGGSLFNLP